MKERLESLLKPEADFNFIPIIIIKPKMPQSTKLKSYYFGIFSEFLVIIFLLCKGYKILRRRFKTKLGEIDIIASKKNTIIAIEVKARKKFLIKNKLLFDEVVSFNQRQRIKKSAISFIKSNKKYQNYNLRFDLVVVTSYRLPLHLIGFWE